MHCLVSCCTVSEVVLGGKDEIMPTKVERSSWSNAEFPPELSVDMDLSTWSKSESDSSGINWYRLSFNKVYCIRDIYWISYQPHWVKWRCTKEDCSWCQSPGMEDCTEFEGYEVTAGVSTAGTPSRIVDSGSYCKYGDTVIMQYKKSESLLSVREFIVKQGESTSTILSYE